MGKKDKGYHKLIVWQRARELVLLIYRYTEQFPASEKFGLTSQIRRATISVALNIVEGYRRKTTKDYLHFLNISNGSLAEVEAASEISLDLGFFKSKNYEEIEAKRAEVGYLLSRLVESLETKK